MNIKRRARRLALGAYNEYKYLTWSSRRRDAVGEYCDDARNKLRRFSPKPAGDCESQCFLPTDPGVDLSVVVPAYNVEDYVAECLNSILNQKTRYSYEIICVDDGSTDRSGAILEGFQGIKIVRQANGGLTRARNVGLNHARGKYVYFIDSDDVAAPGTIETLLNKAYETDYDIVSAGFYRFNEDGFRKNFPGIKVDSRNSSVKDMWKAHCYYWGKIYKRTLFESFRPPEGYLIEDMSYTHIMTRICKSFAHIPEPLYGYRINPKGIMATLNANPKASDQYWLVEWIIKEAERRRFDMRDVKKGLIRELGPFLFNRSIRLDLEHRSILFSCASDLVGTWDLSQLNKKQKRVFAALKRKDFAQWERASSTW